MVSDRLAQCAEVASSLEQLAVEYPGTKFVKIASDECVPGYPDSNLPTIFVYRDKKVILTLAGTGGFGDTKVTPDCEFPGPYSAEILTGRWTCMCCPRHIGLFQ